MDRASESKKGQFQPLKLKLLDILNLNILQSTGKNPCKIYLTVYLAPFFANYNLINRANLLTKIEPGDLKLPIHSIDLFFDYLKGEKINLAQMFTADVKFDAPNSGGLVGISAVIQGMSDYMNVFKIGPRNLHVGKIFRDPQNFVVGEFYIDLIDQDYPRLPIAFAADLDYEDRISHLRLYHSNYALKNSHSLRQPLFTEQQIAETSEIVKAYHQALYQGDAVGAAKLFSNTAIAREPSGDEFGPGKKMHLKAFFDHAFKEGGIRLHYHTFSQHGRNIAAEYTCYYWGKLDIPPQAGMEFWDVNEQNIFEGIRIYDDVEQPNLS